MFISLATVGLAVALCIFSALFFGQLTAVAP